MIDVEQAVVSKFPGLALQPRLIRQPALSFLKKMLHEREVNDFLHVHRNTTGFDFIDAIFDYFHFSYSISARERANIPAEGRLVVIANHPIGSLDGLALLKLIHEVRPDVRIVANDLLTQFEPLKPLLISVDNMGTGSALRSYKNTVAALQNEEAVVVFPAGEVSRARPFGVRDSSWRPGFLHFARRANAPILPVHITAKNSLLFYSLSFLFKPLGTALLAREMFNKRSATIRFNVGEAIAPQNLYSDALHDRTLVRRLRQHLYCVGKQSPRVSPHFTTVRTIAHPENRRDLQRELGQAQLLGETRDQNRIYLFDAFPGSTVMREIGRLREVSFRKVGEGTGCKRDLDEYDEHYRHLVLWDREKLNIAGAYRLGEGRALLERFGEHGFYTRSLYRFTDEVLPYLRDGVELGRSFVNPDYWGKASLDYLWQGIGAYLAHNPQVRYLFGPVSMSASYSRELMEALVFYFQHYHGGNPSWVHANVPFSIEAQRRQELKNYFGGVPREQAFDRLTDLFHQRQSKLPVLFKQYTALYEEDGFQVLTFSVDPDFGDCLDGLCMADLTKLKPAKRRRYIGPSYTTVE